jgi:hypothetical protein
MTRKDNQRSRRRRSASPQASTRLVFPYLFPLLVC